MEILGSVIGWSFSVFSVLAIVSFPAGFIISLLWDRNRDRGRGSR